MMKLIFIFLFFHFTHVFAGIYDDIKNQDAVLIDVREKEEIDQGIIPGAIWFPLSKIENDKHWRKDFVKHTWGKKIYLYCKSGKRAGYVADILKKDAILSQNLGGYNSLKEKSKGME